MPGHTDRAPPIHCLERLRCSHAWTTTPFSGNPYLAFRCCLVSYPGLCGGQHDVRIDVIRSEHFDACPSQRSLPAVPALSLRILCDRNGIFSCLTDHGRLLLSCRLFCVHTLGDTGHIKLTDNRPVTDSSSSEGQESFPTCPFLVRHARMSTGMQCWYT